MPRSRSARWSVNLVLGSVLSFAAFFGLVLSGQKGGDTVFSNPWLAGTITAAAVSAVAGAAAGLDGILRLRERSPAVLVTTTFGLLVLAYAIAEVAFPH